MRALFKMLTLLLVAQALVGLYGCKTSEAEPPDIVGTLVKTNGCKLMPEGAPGRPAQIRMQECLEYDYDGRGTLTLKHVNSGFNCCPGSLSAEVAIARPMIVIVESEKEAGCHCLCLYDLEYRIENLPAGDYTLRFESPYVPGNEMMLSADLELSGPVKGTRCINRNQYPW